MGLVEATRGCGADDAKVVAGLLDEFNREFDTPTPGVDVLASRLKLSLSTDSMLALVTGRPEVGVALVTFRPSVWYDGSVATLDELYVRREWRNQGLGSALLVAVEDAVRKRRGSAIEINVDGEDTDARRFYERHRYSNVEPGQTEPMLYYYREL